jgi:hypothetical protein
MGMLSIARLLDDNREFNAVFHGKDPTIPVALSWTAYFDHAIYGEMIDRLPATKILALTGFRVTVPSKHRSLRRERSRIATGMQIRRKGLATRWAYWRTSIP